MQIILGVHKLNADKCLALAKAYVRRFPDCALQTERLRTGLYRVIFTSDNSHLHEEFVCGYLSAVAGSRFKYQHMLEIRRKNPDSDLPPPWVLLIAFHRWLYDSDLRTAKSQVVALRDSPRAVIEIEASRNDWEVFKKDCQFGRSATYAETQLDIREIVKEVRP